jgi:hypothetical protein
LPGVMANYRAIAGSVNSRGTDCLDKNDIISKINKEVRCGLLA